MWVEGDKTFFDIRLINWLNGRVGSDADEVTHEALCWVTDKISQNKVTTAIIDIEGLRKGPHHVYENFLAQCREYRKTTRIVFLNALPEVGESIHKEARGSDVWTSIQKNTLVILSRKGSEKVHQADINPDKLRKLNGRAIQESIEKAAKKCCVRTNGLAALPSSPVQTNVKFYGKNLICSPINCAPVVRVMAEHVKSFESKAMTACSTLCASSVNGALLAGYVGAFLKRSCLILNHLGPKDKLFEKRVLGFVRAGTPYILLTDYICLGTELRVARSNIENQGGIYLGAVALSALSREITKHTSLKPVVALTYLTDMDKKAKAQIPGLRG